MSLVCCQYLYVFSLSWLLLLMLLYFVFVSSNYLNASHAKDYNKSIFTSLRYYIYGIYNHLPGNKKLSKKSTSEPTVFGRWCPKGVYVLEWIVKWVICKFCSVIPAKYLNAHLSWTKQNNQYDESSSTYNTRLLQTYKQLQSHTYTFLLRNVSSCVSMVFT